MDRKVLDLNNFLKAKSFSDKYKQFDYVFDFVPSDGCILEFGVFKGRTINHIARHFKSDTIYGFDSFEGLPENWQFSKTIVRNKNRFRVHHLPEVKDNVQLIKGWFKDTIDEWLTTPRQNIKLLHIDSDLYSSCKTVLTKLNKLIVPNTVIVFDELLEGNNYSNWQEHEWKALNEWRLEYNREIEVISRTERYQAAIKVIN